MICIKNFLTILVTFFLILSCVLTAQEGKALQEDSKNSLISGSRSLQFRISNNLTLTSFEGAMISAKKHFTSNSALRFGLGLDIRSGQEDYGAVEEDDNLFELELIAQYIYYTSPKAPVNLYLGTGPQFTYNRHVQDRNYEETGEDAAWQYDRSWTIGLLATFGVEWFAIENISFFCEYGASIGYQSRYMESTPYQGYQDQETTQFRLSSQTVDFGLSVYF
ncbi:MAG: hypothetical protein GF310_10225 [candidate division Zixibacteria bacterium]|nr:hypothetical protein [candidate division Zixibacteria bacterium]